MKQKNGYVGNISNAAAQIVKAPCQKSGKKAKSIVKRDGDGRK